MLESMAQCACFNIFFIFLKLQLFYQLQPEVEKLRFFWDSQYSENHRILLKINFLYLHEFLFKFNACKLISKLSTHTFYICVKKAMLCKRLCHLKELGKSFLKIWYFYSHGLKVSNSDQKLVFQAPRAFLKHQKTVFAYHS